MNTPISGVVSPFWDNLLTVNHWTAVQLDPINAIYMML